jgi:hypothetical protein
LDVDEGVVRIGRVREHPAEFEIGDARFDLLRVGLAGEKRVVVGFFTGHVEQILRVTQVDIEGGEGQNDAVERFLLPAEGLGVLRIVPDVRVFEFLVDFG